MTNLLQINSPIELNLLISFIDLVNFTKTVRNMDELEIFGLISEFYETIGDFVEEAGGTVIKFIGDSALVIFPDSKVNEGILVLRDLKTKLDKAYTEKKLSFRLQVKVHFGSVVCGKMGTRTNKVLDIIGTTVNATAGLQSNGFAMTPQVFRKLNKATRQYFKKHTPPIRYIPIEESHRD